MRPKLDPRYHQARLPKTRESGRRIAHGSLYTTFRRLRARGLVAAREDKDGDARIRFFLATRDGMNLLQRSRAYYGRLGHYGLLADGIKSLP